MTTKEELELVLQIIHKHDLPMSPILEYVIKEKLGGNASDYPYPPNCTSVVSDCYSSNASYVEMFENLSTTVQKGRKTPHKAVLLLSILDMIGNGTIKENKFYPNKIISTSFANVWDIYQKGHKVPSVWIPFWYMKSEPFWHFKAIHDENVLQNMLSFAGHPSLGQMRKVIEYAYFDERLFEMIKEKQQSDSLKKILIDTYLTNN